MRAPEVKVTDKETGAYTFCRRDEVAHVLQIWIPYKGVPRQPIVDAVNELQRKLNAGEPAHEEEAFLAVTVETRGPEEDQNRTRE